ncbi:hypothetical protein SERLA73DRAFT_158078 [Serpula lacrymans var. lacrymans S7.3]|uniref:Uncharacterized protein n=2 Tax=Serpula lacrymans var. lacrymans TaxID=341189 RepID=F8PJ61_SERL3|nr:uncharacterized protein SERLADRAFT_412785 [Serpula lacrymans var. lacrymans S7.9]EGO03425.1 hypothetical protein SERLA73DRAFT_158078 [Serpula lacrymans var. lacrymans S7.3]EGO29192.1 hypothetical protein SERLADRAFT_412785 [Serpula lacrymans var. lacrymans S7.9]
MHKLNLLPLFFFLAAGTAKTSSQLIDSSTPEVADCRARPWVRAPDLTPGHVLQGDVKVRLDGLCPDVEKLVLGLRFKERAFLRVLQPGMQRPRPVSECPFSGPLRGVLCPDIGVVNDTELEIWEDRLLNDTVWTIYEEERIAFEVKHVLKQPQYSDAGQISELIQEFGLLIPNTNYPPGLDYINSFSVGGDGNDVVDVQSIYEYFTEVHFGNGTVQEIQAGFTSFIPAYPSVDGASEVVNTTAKKSKSPLYGDQNGNDPMRSNFTVEVTLPPKRTFVQGFDQDVNIVVHRTGLANRAEVELFIDIQDLRVQTLESELFEMYGKAGNESGVNLRYHLRAEFDRDLFGAWNTDHILSQRSKVKFPTPSEDEIANSVVISTSSEPISLPLHVDDQAIPDFATYYQRLKSQLLLVLNLREEVLEEIDPDEDDWVPRSKGYVMDGKPFLSRHDRFDVDISVVSQPSPYLSDITPVHYLSEDARTPVFVDESAINGLLAESTVQRDSMAPLAQPRMCERKGGTEVSSGYYPEGSFPIYVGWTWSKKLNKDQKKNREAHRNPLLVQS